MDERVPKQSSSNNLNEQRNIYKLRIHKFKKSHKLYVIFLTSLAILQFISIAFFAKGFLLTRNVLDNVSNFDNTVDIPSSKFNKTVILIIDALRFDFVIPIEENDPNYNSNYHNNIKILYDNFIKNDNSILLKFMADPPTTTLQRLKGLTTGSLPTFIDAGSNFDGDIIEEDNLIKQLYLNGKDIYFVGDDTWDSLFHPFLSNFSKPFESLNVWDLDTVDNGVISYFNDYLINNHEKNWDILIGHMLGVDHVGHKYGPNHFTMREKQIQMNQFISKVMDSIDDDTLLVIMGDHGMDQHGNHGGDSQDELESTIFLHCKQPGKLNKLLNDKVYDISNLGTNYRKVNQIDLVPTISILLGLPIPFNNLGWPIDEIATNDLELSQFSKLALNQLNLYKETSGIVTNEEQFELLQNLYNDSINNHLKAQQYQQQLLEICKDRWARFDYWSISTGIVLLTISLILLIITTKLIPAVVISRMITEFVPLIIIMALVTNVGLLGVFYVLQQPAFVENVYWCSALATAIGIIIGCFIPIFDSYSVKWILMRFCGELSDYWSRIGAMLLLIHSLLFTSNSFTIWEDKIVSFLLITLGILTLYEFIFVPKRQSTNALLTGVITEEEKKDHVDSPSIDIDQDSLPLSKVSRLLGGYHSLVLIVCTRLASTITICREEQGEYCVPTFTTANNYSYWCMGLLLFMIGLVPSSIKGYYNISSSYQGAAPIWISYLLRGFLLSNFIYWTMTALENTTEGWNWNVAIYKFTLARILTGASIIAANIGWIMGPLCVELKIQKKTTVDSNQATVLGLKNIYGSQFFLLVINALMSILIFNKPLAQLSLYLMVNQILSIMEIIDLFRLKQNIIGPITLSLLAYQQFFSTGHQATIPAVQWDTGFMLTETISFPLTHLAIFLNTFGPFILVALSVALLTLWEQPSDTSKPQTLLAHIASNSGTMLIYNTVLCLSSFIWVTHFRRHLMVWKIFCPRFLFACMCLIVTQLFVTFGTVAFASGRLISQINELFWI